MGKTLLIEKYVNWSFNKHKIWVDISTTYWGPSWDHVVHDALAGSLHFLLQLFSIENRNKALLIVIPNEFLFQFRWVYLISPFWVLFNALTFKIMSVIVWAIIVSWNFVECECTLMFFNLISNPLLHLHFLNFVLFPELLIKLLYLFNLFVISWKALYFLLWFSLCLLNASFFLKLRLVLSLSKSFLELSFVLVNQLNVLLLLKICMIF